MTWLIELGWQIKAAREHKFMSQKSLAALTSITRAQISNIERGKCAPAVNIVAQIAAALNTEFMIEGIRIGAIRSGPVAVTTAPVQLVLALGVEEHFGSASAVLTSTVDNNLSLNLRLTRREVA